LGPRELPAIKVETKIEGKRVSKDFKPMMNTSVFANQIADLLEKSDNREVAIQVKTGRKRSVKERIFGWREDEKEKTPEVPPELPVEPRLEEKEKKEKKERIAS